MTLYPKDHKNRVLGDRTNLDTIPQSYHPHRATGSDTDPRRTSFDTYEQSYHPHRATGFGTDPRRTSFNLRHVHEQPFHQYLRTTHDDTQADGIDLCSHKKREGVEVSEKKGRHVDIDVDQCKEKEEDCRYVVLCHFCSQSYL